MEGQSPSNRSLPAGRMERNRKGHDTDEECSSVAKRARTMVCVCPSARKRVGPSSHDGWSAGLSSGYGSRDKM